MGEQYVISAGARLWTTSTGRGPAVLLFNGGPGCNDYLGPVAALIDDAYQVIRFEPRGCGRSDWDGRYEVATTVADAESIRAAYMVERLIVAGHSAGPDLALAYALQHRDRVIGLVGIAGGRLVNDRDWSRDYHERRETIGETASQEFHADPRVNTVGNDTWKELIKRPSLFRDVADLALPSVFINAGADVRPNWPTQQLAALLREGTWRSTARSTTSG